MNGPLWNTIRRSRKVSNTIVSSAPFRVRPTFHPMQLKALRTPRIVVVASRFLGALVQALDPFPMAPPHSLGSQLYLRTIQHDGA